MTTNGIELASLRGLTKELIAIFGGECNLSQLLLFLEIALRDGREDITVSDIVRITQSTQSSASRRLYTLMDAGRGRKRGVEAVEQYTKPYDRKSRFHRLTRRGREICKEISEAVSKMVDGR